MSTEIKAAIDRIKYYFDPHIKTKPSRWSLLEHYLRIEERDSKSIIKYSDDREGELRFMLKGGGVKILHQVDKEVCIDICFEDGFLSDLESLHTGNMTKISVRTFEPVVMAVLKKQDLFNFYDNSPVGAQLGRVLAQQDAARERERNIILTSPAELIYKRFMEEDPRMLLRAPLRYVASFMGVSPQSLSRIRKKMGE